jgi:rhodanese-related sulfurtransferase
MVETLTRMTATELKQVMASDRPPVVINTLGPDAYRSERIPGSINVPTDDIERVRDLVPAKDQAIVVYCANADCDASSQAAEALTEMGYTNVFDFEAGYAGWREAGFELVGTET